MPSRGISHPVSVLPSASFSFRSNYALITVRSVVLEIGTGEAVSVISNLGQEIQAPGSLISSVRNWPFFRFATCGGHKTALMWMCAHETCAVRVQL